MSVHLLALHGVPTSPALWAKVPLPLDTPRLFGDLQAQVAQVIPMMSRHTVVIGHDMGGVVAAMATVAAVARGVTPQGVVLCGTALGPYWDLMQLTTWPGCWRYFYARHAGKKFVAGAVAPALRDEALRTFPGADPLEMRAIARSMVPPSGLAGRLGAVVPVRLLWGDQDRWYPRVVAEAVARGTGGTLSYVRGGHFVMWENPAEWARAFGSAGG